MIKIILCVSLCVFMPAVLAEFSPEMQEVIDTLHSNCQSQTGAQEGHILACRKGDFADDGNLKCYMKCIMTEMSIMDDSGTVDVEAAVSLMPEDMKGKLEPAFRNCGTQPGADACEAAFNTFKCYYKTNSVDFFLP